MDKYDIRKAFKDLYTAPKADFVVVEVPPMRYLAVDGRGDPNTAQEYKDALEALYPVAYAIKFDSKIRLGRDFVVGPLEGTWRADDMTAFLTREKEAWDWTMMISQPDWVTQKMFAAALEKTAAKKSLPSLSRVTLIELTEGTSVQTLHIGPYDDEGPLLDRLHNEFIPAHGFAPGADHHEIYLSDPRHTSTEKLKTILRQPVVATNG